MCSFCILEIMEIFLYKLLDRYQNLSNYADVKVGALLTISSAIFVTLLSRGLSNDTLIDIYFLYVLCLSFVTIVYCGIGITARVHNQFKVSSNEHQDNLFFFKDIMCLNEEQLLNIATDKYKYQSSNTELEHDIANQIISLAQIADRKLHYYNISLHILFCAITTPIGLLFFLQTLKTEKSTK